MKKYQIILSHGGSSKSFLYFDADDSTRKEVAEKTITDDLEKKRKSDANGLGPSFMYPAYKPTRTAKVVEYDNEKKRAVRGGDKFELEYYCMKAKGGMITSEWYEAVEKVKKIS